MFFRVWCVAVFFMQDEVSAYLYLMSVPWKTLNPHTYNRNGQRTGFIRWIRQMFDSSKYVVIDAYSTWTAFQVLQGHNTTQSPVRHSWSLIIYVILALLSDQDQYKIVQLISLSCSRESWIQSDSRMRWCLRIRWTRSAGDPVQFSLNLDFSVFKTVI